MFILTIIQSERDKQWVSFDTIHQGRQFLQRLPGYRSEADQCCGTMVREWINPALFPDYAEIELMANKIPITRFMFENEDETEVYFSEIPHIDRHHRGLIEGCTTVDAYSIANNEMAHYITTREHTYQLVKRIIEERGMEVDRFYHGSEDGEAIVYRHDVKSDWHLLWHMDPSFVQMGEQGEDTIRQWLNETLVNEEATDNNCQ